MNAAEPRHDHRAEHRIGHQPQHDFKPGRRHLLHQHAIELCRGFVFFRRRHHRIKSLAHRRIAFDMQTDRTGLGLVRNVGRFDFHRHLGTGLFGNTHRVVGGLRQRFTRHRESIRRQHFFARAFGHRAAGFFHQRTRLLNIAARRPCRFGAFGVGGAEFAVVDRRLHRLHARERVAEHRHAGGGDRQLIEFGLVVALANPQHRHRLGGRLPRLDRRLKIGARRHRISRDHHIDVFIGGDGFDATAEQVGLADQRIADVGRIGSGRHFRQEARQFLARLLRILGPAQTIGRTVIDQQHAIAAGNRRRRSARALRNALGTQQHRHLVKLVAIIHADHTALFQRGIGHVIGAGHCAGVRGSSMAAGFSATKFHHHNRFAN